MAAKWRAKNREKIREYFRVYDAQNKEARKERYRKNAVALRARARIRKATAEARAKAREYRIANRTRRNAARRAWGRKNPERAKAIERRRRERNREQRRAANRLYRQQNPEIYKASIARAKAAKPDLYAHIAVNSAMTRRARKRRVHVERVSPRRVFTRDGWRCHLCSESIDRPHRSLDHLIPIVRGGAHAEWNLMAAHVRCNQRRGTKQILTEETKEAAVAYIVARTASQETAA